MDRRFPWSLFFQVGNALADRLELVSIPPAISRYVGHVATDRFFHDGIFYLFFSATKDFAAFLHFVLDALDEFVQALERFVKSRCKSRCAGTK